MNKKLIFHILSKMVVAEAILLFVPMLVSLYYHEASAANAFLLTSVLLLIIGVPYSLKRPKDVSLYAKDGFVIVALTWILWSLGGALPFYISREIPSFIDCLFEAVSGFTTTGASIVPNVEALSHGMLFWRSFTHFIGGMGVLVFVMAILPLSENHSIHLMRAEVPGPVVGKLVSKGKKTAQILYSIYIFMTLLEILFLYLFDMPLFDSVIISLGTAGTGGFAHKNSGIAFYNSAYIDYTISIFMILFGINFNIYYLLLLKRWTNIRKNTELKVYIAVVLLASLFVALNILPQVSSFGLSFRQAFFQVASIITTTGYATTNFSLWPMFSQIILVLLMVIGACAGSTGGGFKVSRVIILFKGMVCEVRKMVHPKSVNAIYLDDKPITASTFNSVMIYSGIYSIILCASILILSLNHLDAYTTVTSVFSCLNNIGPGLGEIIGPVGNYSPLSFLSKLVLSADMLLGRLELLPFLVLFHPAIWSKKHI